MKGKEQMARELILQLGKKLTDRATIKLGLEKLDESSPEYYGLAAVVTDEMAEVALQMDVRVPATPEEIAKKMGKSPEYVKDMFDKMSMVGLLEFHYENNGQLKKWVLPRFIPGCAEYMNMHTDQLEAHPEIGRFFDQMGYLPLKAITAMVPPGGAGIGMHTLPVEKAIPANSGASSLERISHWLDKYDGVYALSKCSCRAMHRVLGDGCGEMEDDCCIAVGDTARYTVETGIGHYATREEVLAVLERAEENGYVHQITNIDGEDKIIGICNCALGSCVALRTSQLFNTPNMSASAYRAHVDTEKCVACGKCAEVCPAGAAKLGQKLCTKNGPVVYPKQPLPDDNHWGEHMWNKDYVNTNQSNCHESGTSPCKTACPAHIAVQGYIKMAAQGRYLDALKLIKQDNPFPAVCGSICNRRCEDACTRDKIDKAVAIDEIKRFIAEKELHEATRYVPKKKFHKGNTEPWHEKIAIIGAGPAGMSCAFFLAEMGYENVTVFDKNPVPGGMLTLGIPSFRLEKDVLNAEIDILKEMGVTFKCGVEVGKDITIQQLRDEGYKGFYLAIGAQKSQALGVAGEDLKGVYGGVDFLREVNLGNKPAIGKKCAVIGGGNVAMDVCRAAVRLGAKDTYIVYRRSADEMPADPEEVREAIEEGVKFRYLSAPVEVEGKDGKVAALKVEIMELGEPDEKGRRKPVGTGKFETIKVDSVIGAIGQTVDWGTLDVGELKTTKKGTAVADELTYQTAQSDIFAGGDVVTGPKFAIDAIAAGKEAAISLHRFVHPGQTLTMGRDRRFYTALDKKHALLDISEFDRDKRQMPGYSEAKAKTFADARVTFTEEQVRKETARCLGCGATKVDEYLCIGCGLCTTKCKFDAIHLKKVRDWHAGTFETMPIKVAEGLVKRGGSIIRSAVKK